jgi:phytoene dehydrogenase-like protein
MDTRPVVVVGAGLAGLTAALELARRAVPVTVLDARGTLGGRARSTGTDGFQLNLGPHALATAGPGTAVLERLGIDLPGRAPDLPRARLLVDGRLVGPLDRKDGAGGLRTLVGLARLATAARRDDPDGNAGEWLATHLPDPRARATAAVLARLATYADALDDQAADVLAEALRGGGVRYLDGGWGALVERLRTAAVTAGAEVRPGSGVRGVRLSADAGWEVVLHDGDVLTASSVVLAAGGPHDAAGLVTGAAGEVLARWAARSVPVRMACLDVALTRRPAGPSLVLGVDEPLYLSVQSDHSRIAPDGAAVVQVARYLPAGAHAPADTRTRLEGLLDQVLPGWRDEVVHARFLPGLVVTHDAGLVASGGRRARPGPEVPGAPGLVVAGDWVGTRGTLSQASIASASQAATVAASHRSRGRAAQAEREGRAA